MWFVSVVGGVQCVAVDENELCTSWLAFCRGICHLLICSWRCFAQFLFECLDFGDVATPTFLGREAANLGTVLCPARCWVTPFTQSCLPWLKPWGDLGEYVGPCLVFLGSPWGLPWDDLDGPTPQSLSPLACTSWSCRSG